MEIAKEQSEYNVAWDGVEHASFANSHVIMIDQRVRIGFFFWGGEKEITVVIIRCWV